MSKILITGPNSFLGKALFRVAAQSYHQYTLINPILVCGDLNKIWNCTDHDTVYAVVNETKPDFIIHTAAYNGGLQYNKEFPSDIFVNNSMMALNLVSVCPQKTKLVFLLSSCSYPDFTIGSTPLIQPYYLCGEPHDSVACQAYAKRNAYLAAKFAHTQYGLRCLCVCPAGLYGPYGTFELQKAKVLHCLINRIVTASRNGDNTVTLLGDGISFRQHIYVEDAAKLIFSCLYVDTNVVGCPIINLSWDKGYTIKELASMVAEIAGYTGEIQWDCNIANGGQYSKDLANNMSSYLDLSYFAPISLYTGIKETIKYFESTYA